MHYWKTDLRTDLNNIVPTSALNPAFWQHMVTFGISIGLTGTVDQSSVKQVIDKGGVSRNGADLTDWPDPTDTENDERIDDLVARNGCLLRDRRLPFAEQTRLVEQHDGVTRGLRDDFETGGAGEGAAEAIELAVPRDSAERAAPRVKVAGRVGLHEEVDPSYTPKPPSM